MSFEIGELVINVQVGSEPQDDSFDSFKKINSNLTRAEQVILIDELAHRVLEKINEQWRERR